MAERWVRPYLDAMCWITALSGTGPYRHDLQEVLLAADRAQLVVVTSVLMPLEVLGGAHHERSEENAEKVLQALSRSSVVRVAVNDRIVRDARRLRLDHGLKSVDALHIASAAAGGADAFLTNDDRVVAVGRHRGVPILRPDWPGDVPLPGLSPDA